MFGWNYATNRKTKSWSENQELGRLDVFGVDEVSPGILKSRNSQISYGLKKLRFRLGSKEESENETNETVVPNFETDKQVNNQGTLLNKTSHLLPNNSTNDEVGSSESESPLWRLFTKFNTLKRDERANARWETLLECIAGKDLKILNRGNKPTFVRNKINSRSNYKLALKTS